MSHWHPVIPQIHDAVFRLGRAHVQLRGGTGRDRLVEMLRHYYPGRVYSISSEGRDPLADYLVMLRTRGVATERSIVLVLSNTPAGHRNYDLTLTR